MTDDIRASLARLKEIPTTNLDAANGELTTLLTGLRKEIESRAARSTARTCRTRRSARPPTN